MATSRPYAINTGSTIDGTQQIGYIAIATGSTLPAEVRWWMGPDEEPGYVITVSDLNVRQSTPVGINAGLRFWRSAALTDASFLGIANVVARRLGQPTFSSASEASAWMTSNGYPTTYTGNVPSIITNENTVVWYDYTNGITKDGSNLVSQWDDKSMYGNHLFQSEGSYQPLYTVDGIYFDGTDNRMYTSTFTWNQPKQIYAVVEFLTQGNTRAFWDGASNDRNSAYINYTTPGRIILFAGAVLPNDTQVTNAFSIIRALYNTVNSSLQVNALTAVTGSTGTNNTNVFKLGSRSDGAVPTMMYVKELIGRNIVDSSTDNEVIYNYLKNKYSII